MNESSLIKKLFAKEVDKEQLTEVIEKASEKYYIDVTFKPNGCVEVFIGSERKTESK